jgi:hypothetical protein
MRSAKRAAVLVLLMALPSVATTVSFAAQAPFGTNHRGASSASHANSNGTSSNSGQWSADPERGWVRDNDGRRTNEQHISTRRLKENKAKQKDKGNKS